MSTIHSTSPMLHHQFLPSGSLVVHCWMIFVNSEDLVNAYLMALCVILLLARSRHPCYSFGQDWMERIFMRISICHPHLRYDVDHVFKQFEEFCKPICNFRIACFKFSKVHQYPGESIDLFYNCILKVAKQCKFSNTDKRVIDAIIFGTNCTKAQDKLLQTPKMLSLQQCLSVC